MTKQKPAGRRRRITDMMGLSEPGKAANPPGPRYLLLSTLFCFVLGVDWLVLGIGELNKTPPEHFFLIAGGLYVAFSAVFCAMWRRSKHRPKGGGEP